jgi:hypothetical protein
MKLTASFACGVTIALTVSTHAADFVVFDFSKPGSFNDVRTNDAVASQTERAALRVVTGTRQSWPGVTLLAERAWNLAPFASVVVPVRNTGTNAVTVSCRVDNPGANGTDKCVTGSITLAPQASGELHVALKRASSSTLDGKLFGMRGYPVARGGPGTVNPSNITQLLLFVTKPKTPHTFELGTIRAGGNYTEPTASVADADPFFPFIDTFGQYRHKDWPGKVHSLAELNQRRADEAKVLVVDRGPADWDKYGGWASGPQLTAAGFFRAEKYNGKWWLIDPDGRLFWSHGIDCVRMTDITPVDERETWFENFPGNDSDLGEFVIPHAYALKGHYAGRSPRCFSFAAANLKRKYGADWKHAVPQTIHLRLRSWGLNTIANWSDEGVRLMRRTPYTDAIGSHGAKNIEGSEGYWGKFPDPFDPGFRAGVRRSAQSRVGRSAGDPWCIGFFSDNEMSWGDDVSLAVAALKSPSTQAAKREFISDLRAKYGDVAKLNAAWGTSHASWDGLLASRTAPDLKKAREDLTAFYSRIAEAYFRTVREALREVAPKQLYLGCRFAWVNARAAAAAAKYCDVVSYNLYRRGIADFEFNGGADVPLIVGEFHLGALDRGMFHTGLVPVENQAARAEIYRSYVESALRHPQFVGTHWFQYQDEPVIGRVYDEENYQIGFVDVADTPYAETIAASRAVAARMYRERAGQR